MSFGPKRGSLPFSRGVDKVTERQTAVRVARALISSTLVALLAAFVLTTPALDGRAEHDFAAYWSATRLLLKGENPYDQAALHSLQEAILSDRERPANPNPASWNPPWLLLALIPMGLFPFDTAVRLMFLVNLFLIAGSVVIAWRWVRPGDEGRGGMVALLAAVFFHGSFMTFMIGQISALVLISLVASLWLLSQRRDVAAGALLLLSLIKPHVVYFVLVILAIWVVRERRLRIVVGGLVALAISLALCTLFYRDWLSGYLALVVGHDFMQYSTSTVGGVVFALTGSTLGRYAGVLLIPIIPAFLKIVDSHGWLTAMNLALLVSLPLAPYGFSFDQIVLVPALVQCVAWVWSCGVPRWLAAMIFAALGIVIAVPYWMMLQQDVAYHLFTWIPIVLFGLYLAIWRRHSCVWRLHEGG